MVVVEHNNGATRTGRPSPVNTGNSSSASAPQAAGGTNSRYSPVDGARCGFAPLFVLYQTHIHRQPGRGRRKNPVVRRGNQECLRRTRYSSAPGSRFHPDDWCRPGWPVAAPADAHSDGQSPTSLVNHWPLVLEPPWCWHYPGVCPVVWPAHRRTGTSGNRTASVVYRPPAHLALDSTPGCVREVVLRLLAARLVHKPLRGLA